LAKEGNRNADRGPTSGDNEEQWLANIESDEERQQALRAKENELHQARSEFTDLNERLHREVAANDRLKKEKATAIAEAKYELTRAAEEIAKRDTEIKNLHQELEENRYEIRLLTSDPKLSSAFKERIELREVLDATRSDMEKSHEYLIAAREENDQLRKQLSAQPPEALSYEELRTRLLARIETVSSADRSSILQDLKTLDAIEAEKRANDDRRRNGKPPHSWLLYDEARQQLLARIAAASADETSVLLKALRDLDDAETAKQSQAIAQADKQESLVQRRYQRWRRTVSDILQNAFKLSAFSAGIYLVMTGNRFDGWLLITGATGWTLTDASLKKIGL
jgi:hypothetical protein